MTREEAINRIEEFMVIDDWSLVYLPDLHDALELAIEALKREQKALELKPLVRNISGWNEVVNEISKLSRESDNRKRDEAE